MDKRELSKKRRRNAKLFSIYKMFSWDLLFYYSIEFLFFTITKGISASEVLIINGIYLISKIIMQIPAVIINDAVGRKKGIIIDIWKRSNKYNNSKCILCNRIRLKIFNRNNPFI